MRFCVVVLLAGLLVMSAGLPEQARAAQLTFVPGNRLRISCLAPISSIAGAILQNGTLAIEGSNIVVKTEAGSNTQNDILSGKVIHAEVVSGSDNNQITVLAVFTSGSLLQQIDDPCQDELVFRNDGALTGRIVGVYDNSLVVQTKDATQNKVSFSSVLFVRSPRAFVFNITLGKPAGTVSGGAVAAEIQAVTVKPTSAKREVGVSSVVPRSKDSDSEFDFDNDDDTYLQPRRLYPGVFPGE